MVTPAVKREAVAQLRALLGLSERRACRIAGADRKMVRYQAQRAPDTELRRRLRELANERRRFEPPWVAWRALLRKTGNGRSAPFPGRTYPTASVTGMPSAVKPLSTAMRIWISAT